jgi:hypothetical protein
MRSILAATALLVAASGISIVGTTTAEAREYPWCSRTSASGFNPSCSFTSYQQCMATVSGQRGDCMRNPVVAFGEQRQMRRQGRMSRQQSNDWDNGWGNGWNDNGWNNNGWNNNGWNQRW